MYEGVAVYDGLINVSVPVRVVAVERNPLVVVGLVGGGDNRLWPVYDPEDPVPDLVGDEGRDA